MFENKKNFSDNELRLNSLLDDAINGLTDRNSLIKFNENNLINSCSSNSHKDYTRRKLQYELSSLREGDQNKLGLQTNDNDTLSNLDLNKNQNKDTYNNAEINMISATLPSNNCNVSMLKTNIEKNIGISLKTLSNLNCFNEESSKRNYQLNELEDFYDVSSIHQKNKYCKFGGLAKRRNPSKNIIREKHDNSSSSSSITCFTKNNQVIDDENDLIKKLNHRIQVKILKSKEEEDSKIAILPKDSSQSFHQEPKSSVLKKVLGDYNNLNNSFDSCYDNKEKFKANKSIKKYNPNFNLKDRITDNKNIQYVDVKSELINLQNKLINLERKLGKFL